MRKPPLREIVSREVDSVGGTSAIMKLTLSCGHVTFMRSWRVGKKARCYKCLGVGMR